MAVITEIITENKHPVDVMIAILNMGMSKSEIEKNFGIYFDEIRKYCDEKVNILEPKCVIKILEEQIERGKVKKVIDFKQQLLKNKKHLKISFKLVYGK